MSHYPATIVHLIKNICKLPGIGEKTAERLVLDLRDKLDDSAQPFAVDSALAGESHEAAGPRREAFNALTALGYKPAEARRMLDGLSDGFDSTEDILRNVLQTAAAAGGR